MDAIDVERVRGELQALLDACRAQVDRLDPGEVRWKLTDDGRREPVSELDVRLEDTLRGGLRRAFPRAEVFGEESEHERAAIGAGLCFVIDPIDGTKELLAGRSGFATSVAVLSGGVPRLGVVDFPARDQRFVCLPGNGVELNGWPLRGHAAARADRERRLVRLAVSPVQARAEVLERLARAWPDLELVPVGAVANKLALLCLGDVDAAVFLPISGGVVALWDYLGFAVGLPALGLGFRDLATDRDLAAMLPTYWRNGWVAGTAEGRARLRAALAASGISAGRPC
ncbi:MAG TPA: inositol monophosphatase family protein [Actinomycetes bacterium]|nr:inositol monophosphatase family protein [Actinomycetes bacterium]